MTVTIEFIGNHRAVTNTDSIKVPITGKMTANDVLDYLVQHYPGLALAGESVVITVNHSVVPGERLLKANDIVCFLPYIGGG